MKHIVTDTLNYFEAQTLKEATMLKSFAGNMGVREAQLRVEKGITRLYACHHKGNLKLYRRKGYFILEAEDKNGDEFLLTMLQHGGTVKGTLFQNEHSRVEVAFEVIDPKKWKPENDTNE